LTLLCLLYGLIEIQKDIAPLYETKFFAIGAGKHLDQALKEIMVKLRPQMIPLVESFAIPDGQLVSAIGNSYGDIYET